ncbi:MAG TPA: site-specific DNA-methyltransferase [bacterium]|nr:site-specific DNA-methyltransferase [bacterium]
MATLNFRGKTFVQNHHLAVKYHQLVPKRDKSLTDKVNLNDNLILHGDNLKALKALLPTYAGKVKCIYIDPPYNTGNERWVFNDNVNNPMMQEWLGKIVNKEDLTRHDKWLCMMMPRLRLLRELLREDGVIFVSADDNEIHRLRMLMDAVFQGNFVGMLIWRKKEGGGQTDDYFVTEHEYILVYAKSPEFKWIDETIEVDQAAFNREDSKGKFTAIKLAKWGSGARREDRTTMYFPIKAPDGKNIYPKAPDGREGRWRVGKVRMAELIRNERIDWQKKNGEWIAYEKAYYDKRAVKKIKERSILYEIATTGDAANTLTQIFGVKDVFENPKPVELVKFFIRYTTDKSSVVLDSFAGSGTTAHAVLDLNKEDRGNRKFILIQCDEFNKLTGKIEDICNSITAERVRRVIKGIAKAKNEKLREGLGGTFSYFELGDPIEMESILEGDNLPSFLELARYVFYTATGEEFDLLKVDKKRNFIGDSKEYEVYLFYKPDIEYLKATALTLERAKNLGPYKGKKRLVFAPSKYLDTDYLLEYRIDYCQLPFEIYRLKE